MVLKKAADHVKSSTKVEFRSIAATVNELEWLKSLLEELRVGVDVTMKIYCDN